MDSFAQVLGFADVQDIELSSPQSWTFLIMLCISMLYGMMLKMLYKLYYRESEPLDASLARSLVLLTPTLMTIFWIIQFSLPLSVGLLGTLSFVRFRSPVKRAEDISFIVVALACAISCAILKPLIGGGLVLMFILFSLVRNRVGVDGIGSKNFAVLTYNTKLKPRVKDLEKILRDCKCRTFEFVSSRTYDGITSYVFNISNLHKTNLHDLSERLETADRDANINIFFPHGRLGV